MNQGNSNIEKKKCKHLSLCERKEIEKSLSQGFGIRQIAKALARSPSTISREIKRGNVMQRRKINSFSRKVSIPLEVTEQKYFADAGQAAYVKSIGLRGGKYKLYRDYELLKYIEDKILNNKYSPDAILGQLKQREHPYQIMVCTKTVYNYIERGLMNVKNIDLLLKCRRKPKKQRILAHKRIFGDSIDTRPQQVAFRKEFGHYEGDTVVGKDGKSAILTLVERKTRKGFMLSLKDKSSDSVLKALKQLKRTLPAGAIKSITFDNGSEFATAHRLKTKHLGIYFAHPYSAYERGSNEHFNGIIRRFVPKGKDFNKLSQNQLNRINNWINSYPRKSLNYKSAQEAFDAELLSLQLTLGLTVN